MPTAFYLPIYSFFFYLALMPKVIKSMLANSEMNLNPIACSFVDKVPRDQSLVEMDGLMVQKSHQDEIMRNLK